MISSLSLALARRLEEKNSPLFCSTKFPICVSVFNLNNNTEHTFKMEFIGELVRSYVNEYTIDLETLDMSDEMKQSAMEDIFAAAVRAVTEAVLADPRLVAKMDTIRASAAGAMDAVEAHLDQVRDKIVSSSLYEPSGPSTNSG